MHLKSLLFLALGLVGLTAAASAQIPIPLMNGGFELPAVGVGDTIGPDAVGWSEADTPLPNNVGVIRPQSFLQGQAFLGKQVLAMNPGSIVSQRVSTPVSPGKSYVVSYAFGDPLPNIGPTEIRCEILVDGALVFSEKAVSFGDDRLKRVNATYTHPSASLAGSSLTIRFESSVSLLLLDDVQLHEAIRFMSVETFAISGFEDDPGGATLAPVSSADGWSGNPNLPSNAMILPNGGLVTGSQGNMPFRGSQWLELTNAGSGVGSAELESAISLDFYAQTDELSFNWDFATRETVGDMGFFDTVEARLFDLSTGVPNQISSAVLMNTSTTQLPFDAVSLQSGTAASLVYGSGLSNVQLHQVAIPANCVGKILRLEIAVVNQNDSSFASAVFIDNVVCGLDVFRTGTNEGPVMGTGVVPAGTTSDLVAQGAMSGGPGNDRKLCPEGSQLQVGWFDPSNGFVNRPVILLAELLTSGNFPAGFPQFGIALSSGNSFVLANGLSPDPFAPLAFMAPTGQTRSFLVPAGQGLVGQSLLLQTLVPATFAGNGILATTDMHEIVFTP